MERIEREQLSEIILAAPAWARIGLTVRDERLRERAADTLAAAIIERLERDPVNVNQLALPF